MVLKKIRLENLLSPELLYTKLVRGNLPFTVESHLVDDTTKLTITLKRANDRIDELITRAQEKGLLTKQTSKFKTGNGVLRLYINDDNFMINNISDANVTVTEYNFNPKDFSIKDFPNGKVQIDIEILFAGPTDNSKFKKELKDFYNKEETIC